MREYIALDIGGTMIKHGIINENAEIVLSNKTITEAKQGGPYLLCKIQGIIDEYREKFKLEGICISTAGIVDPILGSIIYANENIPDYTGMEIKRILEEKYRIPCEVENDVACAALSENYSGASRGSAINLCLTIGTGIGGCIIIENKIYHGFSSSAGEIGYMNMFGSNFEDIASSSALERKVAELKDLKNQELSGIEIFEMAKSGDQICMDCIDAMCDCLGYGIANICYVLNPEVVVIGGGITEQKAYLYERIRKSLDHYLIEPISKKTRLAFAVNGNMAGMLGAYYNFREKH